MMQKNLKILLEMEGQMPADGVVHELAFVVPNDIQFGLDVSGLDDEGLMRYHDMMHIFWEKVKDGLGEHSQFEWTFNKIIFMHTETTKEMLKRGIKHYEPINSLDGIYYYDDKPTEEPKKDFLDVPSEMSQEAPLTKDVKKELISKEKEEVEVDFEEEEMKITLD